MGKSKWGKRKIGKAVMDNKEEFAKLQLRLLDLMVDFGLLAVKTFQAAKGEPLNVLEINQVVTHEFEVVKAILSQPNEIDIVAQKVEFAFGKE